MDDVEAAARQRIRSLRIARGWSLDELGERAAMGPSTLSRIETGKRPLSVDHLVVLARSLDVSVEDLLAGDDGADVVIRPRRDTVRGITHWHLSRADDPTGRSVVKMRFPASRKAPDPKVHPGRDWLFVLEGALRLVLGDREVLVQTGEAAEFDCMTPHWMAGQGGPVEIIAIYDRHGQGAHLHG